MTGLIAVVLFVAVLGTLIVLTKRGPAGHNVRTGHIDEDVWAAARESVAGTPMQPFVSLARPFESIPMVWDQGSSLHRHLQQKLLASGGLFGSSVEVFLSVQIAALLGAACCLVVGFTGLFSPIAMCAAAIALSVAPYGQIDSLSRRRMTEVTRALPEFAEMLLMPLNAGLAVIPSLEFCSTRVSGPVAAEVRNMMTLIRTRAMDDTEAFAFAGARLGTGDARSFFNALLNAHLEGVRVVDNLAAQADALRAQMYQQRRAEAKKLPVKLILVFGVHLLPLVFAVALVPALIAISTI